MMTRSDEWEAAMAERLGGGEWSFEVEESWAKIPDEIVLGDCAAVGVDSKDNVYAFNRGDHPIAVFDQAGNLLRTWGEGVFTRPHGVHMAPDDTIWLTDDGDHTVRRCTLDGRVLLTIGVPGKPSPFMSGEPFHRCTHTALSPQCDHLYISDGYGNARIYKFTVDGKLLGSWGEPGTDPGQFNIPHNICCDPEGWLYVADRENHRVQVFDGNGKWQTQWNYLHRPNGMCLARGPVSGQSGPLCYIGEGGPSGEINRDWPNIGPRVSIHTLKGERLAQLGKPDAGILPGQFTSPHGIAVDSRGNIYVGELSGRSWSRFSKDPAPKKRRVIHRLKKVAA
jgi:sugar lactone lactonase YvrE